METINSENLNILIFNLKTKNIINKLHFFLIKKFNIDFYR